MQKREKKKKGNGCIQQDEKLIGARRHHGKICSRRTATLNGIERTSRFGQVRAFQIRRTRNWAHFCFPMKYSKRWHGNFLNCVDRNCAAEIDFPGYIFELVWEIARCASSARRPLTRCHRVTHAFARTYADKRGKEREAFFCNNPFLIWRLGRVAICGAQRRLRANTYLRKKEVLEIVCLSRVEEYMRETSFAGYPSFLQTGSAGLEKKTCCCCLLCLLAKF